MRRPHAPLVLSAALALLSLACDRRWTPSAPRSGGAQPPRLGGPPPVASPPGSLVRWLMLPPTNAAFDPRWGPRLTDIMQRKPPRERGFWEDHSTLAHEMSHSIHFEVRLANSSDRPRNGFYVFDGRAAVVAEPGIRISTVAPLVPPSLRRNRYPQYITGKPGWDARPLYVWDEWTAYINGATVAVERYQLGLSPHTAGTASDRVFAVLEFTIYAMTVVLAVSQYDPRTLQEDPQFREFFAWNAQRAMATFEQGKNLPPFQWPESARLLDALRAAPDAEPLRHGLRSVYGASWTRQVFGF